MKQKLTYIDRKKAQKQDAVWKWCPSNCEGSLNDGGTRMGRVRQPDK